MRMRKRDRPEAPAEVKAVVRCAIYTRKSSEDGLEQEFNSLDAQRDSAEAFIASQRSEGWTVVADQYNDGGFSGGSLDRPGLERMLTDIRAGKIDCVVVYKVDRLSRSLTDFGKLMAVFDQHRVSFVSVTQQFNTTTSMGRLTLNILLSFAQFEREIIGERIRDKIAAQKRKGKWAGGVPVLGYDVDRSGPSPRLVVNAEEAARVRVMFEMYAKQQSLLKVAQELARRGWTNKRRVTKQGKVVGGQIFDKISVYAHLINPVYIGKICHKGTTYDGEHEGIVPVEVFNRVQAILKHNGGNGGRDVRNKHGVLLRGLLRCKACERPMVHSYTMSRRATEKHYRYYRCLQSLRRGVASCDWPSLPAGEIEKLVVEEIRGIATDGAFLTRVVGEAQAGLAAEVEASKAECLSYRRMLDRLTREQRRLVGQSGSGIADRLADTEKSLEETRRSLGAAGERLRLLEAEVVQPKDAARVFRGFDGVWNELTTIERGRLVKLLVEVVEYDGAASKVRVVFRPSGIRAFASGKTGQIE